MTHEELVAAMKRLVGDRYFSVERSSRCYNGVASEYWSIAVSMGDNTPMLIVSEVHGPKHDYSSASDTFNTLQQMLTLPTAAPESTEAA